MTTTSHWQPTPLIKASIALHAAAGALPLLDPAILPHALAAVIANQGVLTAAGLWPRSHLLGPNLTHLPASAVARRQITLTFDDGPDPDVTPHVLRMLEEADIRASFFCIGTNIVRHAGLAREIAACGHEIENHTENHWKTFAALGPWRMRDEIVKGQESIAETVGRTPRFFRPTAGLRNPFLDPILSSLNLRLATWTRRAFDSRCRDVTKVHLRLTKNLTAGDILLLHDGLGAKTPTGQPVILEALPRLLESIQVAGLQPVPLSVALSNTANSPAS